MAVGGAPLAEMEDEMCSVFSDLGTHLSAQNASEPDVGEFHDVLQPGWGPRVSSALLCPYDKPSGRNTEKILEELHKTVDGNLRAAVFQYVIFQMIPKLSEERKLCDLSHCVLDSNREVQDVAITWLETTILELRHSDDAATLDGLLAVASCTLTAFQQEIQSDRQMYTLLHLHLLAVSALLCRCRYFQTDQLASFRATLKQHKTHDDTPLKRKAVDVLKMFYKYFKHHSRSSRPFSTPDWASMDWGREASPRRNESFKFTSFCQYVVNVYKLLSEILHQGWSRQGRALLGGLRKLCHTFPRAGKYRVCEEVVDFMLLRCLNSLLRHRFARDLISFGKAGCRDHNELIVGTMLDIIKKDSDPAYKKLLMQEIKELPFHNSEIVRQAFNCYLSGKSRESPIEFFKRVVVGFLEKNLRLIGFQRDRTGSTERAAGETQEECSWLEITCTVANKPAEGAVYVPKPSCLSKSTNNILMCVCDHPGNMEILKEKKLQITQKAQRHRVTLDNLRLLSYGCRNILNLFAYQIKPFPFYITEAVDNRRLLEFLLDHRNVQQRISNAALVQIIQDVVKGLMYMARQMIVTRDITAYSMIVDVHGVNTGSVRESASRLLSLGNFIVKIVELGLAFPLPAGAAETTVTDEQPVPVRWTPAEALFDGIFSEKSMVYSLAFLIYECWTHGCQPFTDYDKNMQTKEILHLFHSQRTEADRQVKVQPWPCIPEDVFRLIKKCTHHERRLRPSLQDVYTELRSISLSEEPDGETEPELDSAIRWTKKYPALAESQRYRRHIPEMGTSAIFDH